MAVLVLVALVAGCGPARPTTAPAEPQTATAAEPKAPPAATAASAPAPPAAPTATAPAAPRPPLTDLSAWSGPPALPGALLVMVDNIEQARPQAGIEQADVVYEAVAEADITRFLAVFYHRAPQLIGPVRSARFYFVQLAMPYSSPYAHAGGNADALAMTNGGRYGGHVPGVEDLDAIYNAGGAFWRSQDRPEPWNLWTSSAALLAAAKGQGYHLSPPPPLPQGVAAGGDAAPRLDIQWSLKGELPNHVTWLYQNGLYLREVNGSPHVVESGTQIAARDVVVMDVSSHWIQNGADLEMDTEVLGTGRADLFEGGRHWVGTWSKPSAKRPLTFPGFTFGTGPLWIEIVPAGRQVTW